jgi:hypothetical protein
MISHFSQRSSPKGLGFITTANWLRKCSLLLPIPAHVRRAGRIPAVSGVQAGDVRLPIASSIRGAA